MRTLRVDLQYVGTRYAGWQVQPGVRTVQGTIETSLARLLDETVRIHGAGRTDAGVHARGQVAHFETRSALDTARIRSGANHFLPPDIRLMQIREAPAGFHARRSALSKEYRYRIVRAEVMPPHLEPFALHHGAPLDMAAMTQAAAVLIGRHDFAAFRSKGSSAETSVRTVHRSEWMEEGEEIIYRIEADGFLYKMVRAIVGLLLEIGEDRCAPERVARLLAAPDRALAGAVSPAHGLHLWRVRYPGQAP